MDPLSLTASIIAVAGAGIQISVKLCDVARQIKSAPDTVSTIANDMLCHCKLLRQFGKMLEEQNGLYTNELVETVRDILWQFRDAHEKLEALLSACSRGYQRLKIVFRANRIKNAQKRMKGLARLLSLAMQVLNMAKTKQENRLVQKLRCFTFSLTSA